MKKVVFVSAGTILLALAVHAQSENFIANNDLRAANGPEVNLKKVKEEERRELRKLKSSEVSVLSKNAFYVDFDRISPISSRQSNNFDEFTFIKNNQEMTAFYDFSANLVGTTEQKSFNDLPESAQRTINSQYPGYKVGDVILFDDNEFNETDMILFNQSFDDADNYFVKLSKGNDAFLVKVNMEGEVSYFEKLK